MSIMHSMSDEERMKYKAQKTKEMRDYNADLIADLGISPFDFNMKTQFYDEQARLVVGIFPSEFKKTKGFYFELIDSDLNPVDPAWGRDSSMHFPKHRLDTPAVSTPLPGFLCNHRSFGRPGILGRP